MKLGAQLSTTRGLKTAIMEASERGLSVLQVFSRSPVGGQSKELPKTGTVSAWLEQAHIRPFFVHAPYFVNPAATDPTMQERARAVLAEEMVRVKRLHGDFLVLHPGHCQGIGDEAKAAGLEILAGTLRYMLTRPGIILMENTAGQGRELGSTFDELHELFRHLGRIRRVGILLDTAHAMAAGFPLHTTEDVTRFLGAVERGVGLNRVRGVHLNDNAYPVGSHRDRHAHLLTGHLGLPALKALLREAHDRSWPLILETPGSTVEAREHDLWQIEQLL
ncbi:MAG: deoxyribonuclease IV [Sulfobacillus thermotolerans]|nr:deoxyribonuclease IV [Sulfobacillus thermotolerans]